MYLYYFERVLRWAANDDTLRLPLLGLYRPDAGGPARCIPSRWLGVYDPKRQPALNNGSATLDPNSTNVNDALNEPDYRTYQNDIQDGVPGVHSYVHCTVGPTCPVAHMGDVPVAGNDAVFYHHHANIDRLWACWQQTHTSPPGSWQDQIFSFVDETGTLVTRPVKDFLDSTTLGYVYDNVSSCARPTAAALERVASPQTVTPPPPTTMVHATESIPIRSPSTSVNLNVPPTPLATFSLTPVPRQQRSSSCSATSPRTSIRARCSTSTWRRRPIRQAANTSARFHGSAISAVVTEPTARQ